LQAAQKEEKTKVLILCGKETDTQKRMVQALKAYGSGVRSFKASFKEILNKKKDIAKLKQDIKECDILVLDSFQEQLPLLLKEDKDFRQDIKDFFQRGGVMLSLLSWVYSDGFVKFCEEEKIWFPDYNEIKLYTKYRRAFPSNFFMANEKISHPLLLNPNKLKGVMGYQNFGYMFPKGKDFYALAIRENNSKSTGLTLQEGINGNGAIIFSCLYEFISRGKKTLRDPKDPLAKHSMLFIENLIDYAQKRKVIK
jgi:hypothetical protein